MDDFWFFALVWTVISLSNLAIGRGCLKGGQLLRPHGGLIRKIGVAFVLHGIFGGITVVIALIRHAYGYNPAFQGIGTVAYVRTAVATAFWPGIAFAVNYTVWHFHNLSPADQATLVNLHAAAFRLEKRLNNVGTN